MKIRITNGMLMALIINMMYAKAIGVTQGMVAREVGSDMWISTLLAIAQGTVTVWLVIYAVQQADGMEMIDGIGAALGKWAGKGAALIVFVFFAGTYGTIMITFVYHLMDYFLPLVPTYLFILIALWVGCFGAFQGLEVMARAAFVGVFTILCLNVSLLAGSVYEFDIRNIAPVLESGLASTVWASRFVDTDWAIATMTVGVVVPFVNNKGHWSKTGIIGLMMGGLLISMWPLMEAGVLSAPVAGQYVVSCMQMARSAHLGHFIHRYEMIMVLFFATSIMVQIMVCLYCASHALTKVVGAKNVKLMLVPTALVLGGFSYWIVTDHFRAMIYAEDYWPTIAVPIAVIMPLILLTASLVRKKMKSAQP